MIPKEHSRTTPDATKTVNAGCVLVVDDNDKLRALLTMGLRIAGYPVVAAASQVELQRHLSTLTPAALVVNLQRSQSEGVRLLARLRARADLLRTPILFLSGSDDDRLREDAFAAGADFYGLRPFGVVELQKAVDGLLRHGRPSRSDSIIRPPTRLDRLQRLRRARRLRQTG